MLSYFMKTSQKLVIITSQRKHTITNVSLDIVCNDGKFKMDVATIAGGEMRYKIADMMKNEMDIFNFCNLPSSDQKFRVAYNIWKPFVFKR